MKEVFDSHEDAERALRLLARAPLPEGMEERLTAGLRGRQMVLTQRAAARGGFPLPGMYALAAFAVGRHLGVRDADIIAGLSTAAGWTALLLSPRA